eukprot:767981-Hanusia_phi.AAC.1
MHYRQLAIRGAALAFPTQDFPRVCHDAIPARDVRPRRLKDAASDGVQQKNAAWRHNQTYLYSIDSPSFSETLAFHLGKSEVGGGEEAVTNAEACSKPH